MNEEENPERQRQESAPLALHEAGGIALDLVVEGIAHVAYLAAWTARSGGQAAFVAADCAGSLVIEAASGAAFAGGKIVVEAAAGAAGTAVEAAGAVGDALGGL